jgi:hypothetical protein
MTLGATLLMVACVSLSPSMPRQNSRLVLSTVYGNLEIELRPDLSPESIEYIQKVSKAPIDAQHNQQLPNAGCSFYRLEAITKSGVVQSGGNPGPPYALLQGALQASGVPPLTTAPKTKAIPQPMLEAGMVAWAGK